MIWQTARQPQPRVSGPRGSHVRRLDPDRRLGGATITVAMSEPQSPAPGEASRVQETNRLELQTHEPSGRRMINQYIMCVACGASRD